MEIYYKKWKKYNEIQLTKNKMDLNIRKMTNRPPSPVAGSVSPPNLAHLAHNEADKISPELVDDSRIICNIY